ncbi:MAG TPA: type II toxin-antitoxin system prevent-host-death family antitoxin [Acidimicrobiales bacterium]|nr:type II toxin-antitoxin system prevent-host-death family antitoxin [Acidimicrobiales bacterium]
MEIINTHDAKTQFSKLLTRAANGEEIVIARAGKPMAKLVPFRIQRQARKPGAWRGRVRVADDFDRTPDDLLDAFDGRA